MNGVLPGTTALWHKHLLLLSCQWKLIGHASNTARCSAVLHAALPGQVQYCMSHHGRTSSSHQASPPSRPFCTGGLGNHLLILNAAAASTMPTLIMSDDESATHKKLNQPPGERKWGMAKQYSVTKGPE